MLLHRNKVAFVGCVVCVVYEGVVQNARGRGEQTKGTPTKSAIELVDTHSHNLRMFDG